MEGCEARERRGNARGARRGGKGEGIGAHGRKKNRTWKGVRLGNGEEEARGARRGGREKEWEIMEGRGVDRGKEVREGSGRV